jgi:hypothetical protein
MFGHQIWKNPYNRDKKSKISHTWSFKNQYVFKISKVSLKLYKKHYHLNFFAWVDQNLQ